MSISMSGLPTGHTTARITHGEADILTNKGEMMTTERPTEQLDNLFEAFDEASSVDEAARRDELVASGVDRDELVEQGRRLIQSHLDKKRRKLRARPAPTPERARQAVLRPMARARTPSPARLKLVERKSSGGRDDSGQDDDACGSPFRIALSFGDAFKAERTTVYSFIEGYNRESASVGPGGLRLGVLDLDQTVAFPRPTRQSAPELFIGIVDWRHQRQGPQGCAVLHDWNAVLGPRALFLHYVKPTLGVVTDDAHSLGYIQSFDSWATSLSRGPFVSQPFYDLRDFEQILCRELDEVLISHPMGSRQAWRGRPTATFTQSHLDEIEGLSSFHRELHLAAATVEVRSQFIQRLLAQRPGLGSTGEETIGIYIDALYSRLDCVCRAFDREQPEDFYGSHQIYFDKIQILLAAEHDLWRELRRCVWYGDAHELEKMELLARICSGRRATTVADVERLLGHFSGDAEAASVRGVDSSSERFTVVRDGLERLEDAHELDEEGLMAEILAHADFGAIEQLLQLPVAESEPLIRTLWLKADWALAYQGASSIGIYSSLVAADRRFEVLDRLTRSKEVTVGAIEHAFRTRGYVCDERDREVVWKCLTIGHRERESREIAADRMGMDSLWNVSTCPYAPIQALSAIASRIKNGESENFGKVFFDCVRSRLAVSLGQATPTEIIAEMRHLLLTLFRFDFFIESSYFQRLEALLVSFLESGVPFDLGKEMHRELNRLRQRRSEAGNPENRPLILLSLPLAVQRYMAKDKLHYHQYLSHPDYRIARETLPHVRVGNLSNILKNPSVNGLLLREILKKDDLFPNERMVRLALSHPKCNLAFAMKRRTSLTPWARAQLARNPSANPDIRRLLQPKVGAVARRARNRGLRAPMGGGAEGPPLRPAEPPARQRA